MTKEEMFALLSSGRSHEWNEYRKRHPEWIPDLSKCDISKYNLAPNTTPFDLSKANLLGCKLPTSKSNFEYFNGSYYTVNLRGAMIDIDTSYCTNFNLIQNGAIFVSKSETSSDAGFNPVIFISYAWANDEIVLAIDAWLQTKGLQTKIDKRDFFAGSRIRDEIIRVMSECNVILIFYSNKYKGKPWPEFEQELASDLEMEAKKKGSPPPLILYLMIDDSLVTCISESNKIHIIAKGKRFELVCEEIYHNILRLPKKTEPIDLSKWSNYTF